MDLMYLPDAFTFHVIRSPSYDARDYLDAAWEEEEERLRRQRRNSGGKGKKGKSPACTNNSAATTSGGARSGGGHQRKPSGGGGKDTCPMCKERKRRTLATYIRTKSRQDSECTIEEEEEENGGEDVGGGGCVKGAAEGNPAKEHECASRKGAEERV